MRRSWSSLLIALLLAPAVSSSAAQSAPAVNRDTIVIGTAASEPDTLNPLFEGGPVSAFVEIIPALFTIDVERDETWRTFPQGVDYLPTVADGTWKLQGERMILTWRIRRRSWHDGVPVTCADYVFSHRVANDQRVRVMAAARASARIASVSCPRGSAGREITVVWKQRYAYANVTVFGLGPPIPRHLVEPFYRTDPIRLRRSPYGSDPRRVVGDGPYRLVDWRLGDALTLEAVPNHPLFGTPKTKKLVWRFFPTPAAAVDAMLAGQVDVTLGTGLSFERAVELERVGGGRFRVLFAPGLTWEHIDFNFDNLLLRDVRVRRAIAHAINRTQIVQQFVSGRAAVAHSYLPPRHLGFTEGVPKYAYDPSRAKALLQEAGFRPGSDGVMRDGAGRKLELEISTRAGNPLREETQRTIQDQLHQVGIEVVILNFPFREFFSERLNKRQFMAMALYAWTWDPISDCDLLYTSDGIPTEANTWRGSNHPGYRNPEMDRVCKAIAGELDDNARKALLQESARLFARDLPALPLYFRLEVAATKAGLRNVRIRGLGVFETWNVSTWYWE